MFARIIVEVITNMDLVPLNKLSLALVRGFL